MVNRSVYLIAFFYITIINVCLSLNIPALKQKCTNMKVVKITNLINAYSVEVNVFLNEKISQVDSDCFYWNKNYFTLNVIWNKKKVLDESFQITALKTHQTFSILIQLIDIVAFNLKSNLFFDLSKKVNISSIYFHYSKFKTLLNCSANFNTNSNQSKDINFFGKLKTIGFAFTVTYFKQTCPLVFLNSKIENIYFYGLSDTFLKPNVLGFLSTNNSLNSDIKQIFIYGYRLDLDKQMLSANIFKMLVSLNLFGQFKFIGKEVLQNFDKLVYLAFSIRNLREFLYQNSKSLHEFITNKQNFTRVIQIQINENYQFPDEDFCLFKDFYASNSTFVFISSPVTNCSDTLKMLLKNSNLNQIIEDFIQTYGIALKFNHCPINLTLETQLLNSISKHCHKAENINPKSERTDQDIIYFSQIFNFSTILISPVLCLITIIINLINLKILVNIKAAKRSTANYLMTVCSIINLVFSVIFSIHLVNKCVYVNGIFCSAILRHKYVQWYDIIFVEFILGMLKIWSNITIIGISWLRLNGLATNDNSIKFKRKIEENKKSKILIILFLILSIILSIDKLFTVRINDKYFLIDYQNYEEFPNRNTFMLNIIRDVGSHSYEQILYSYNQAIFFYITFVLSFIVNDFLLYLILFLIDLYIVIVVREKLKFKVKLAKKLDTKEEKNLENTEKKINYTICWNLLIVFVLKFCHFGVSLYIFMKRISSNRGKHNICFNFSQVCSNYLEFSELFYILSNSYSIILFKNLNQTFKDSLNSIFKNDKVSKLSKTSK